MIGLLRHGDGGVIDLEVGENRGDFERMIEVGVAGGALLRAMLLHGIDVGLVEQILVRGRIVGLHLFDEFVLAHHPAPRSTAANKKAPEKPGASIL